MNRSRYGFLSCESTAAPSSVNSMMSSRSTSSGDLAHDSKNLPLSSGWRALTCPNASTIPSDVRIRLAITRSSISESRVAMPFLSRRDNLNCFWVRRNVYLELIRVEDMPCQEEYQKYFEGDSHTYLYEENKRNVRVRETRFNFQISQ